MIFWINISLDGHCDHTLFKPNEELHAYFISMMNQVDLIVHGRIMYQLMFPYWALVAIVFLFTSGRSVRVITMDQIYRQHTATFQRKLNAFFEQTSARSQLNILS